MLALDSEASFPTLSGRRWAPPGLGGHFPEAQGEGLFKRQGYPAVWGGGRSRRWAAAKQQANEGLVMLDPPAGQSSEIQGLSGSAEMGGVGQERGPVCSRPPAQEGRQ